MGPISETAPLSELTFVGFDTETTGLSPLTSRLVELSGVKFGHDGTVLSTFSTLIDPESEIPPDATRIHGITQDMVDGKPTYAEAVPDFFRWAGGTDVVLAAHNAQFDIGFLETAMARLGLDAPTHPVLDTLNLSRRLLPKAPNHQLQTLSEHLGLESGGFHRALADSYHVRDLLVRLLSFIPEVETWGALTSMFQTYKFTNLSHDVVQAYGRRSTQVERIRDAISTGTVISMVYQGSETSSRLVTPRSVHKWKGTVYLTAYCHASSTERTFRLDKIESFEPADRLSDEEVKQF